MAINTLSSFTPRQEKRIAAIQQDPSLGRGGRFAQEAARRNVGMSTRPTMKPAQGVQMAKQPMQPMQGIASNTQQAPIQASQSTDRAIQQGALSQPYGQPANQGVQQGAFDQAYAQFQKPVSLQNSTQQRSLQGSQGLDYNKLPGVIENGY